ncbi:natural killer cells antigen CD94-like [Odontesthes bonariensis]|uniref:natural killer cells antigen CD94-like n=1 Tax=Odontesthes bonariensis TaxID=219752 RepID=UPI003F586C52
MTSGSMDASPRRREDDGRDKPADAGCCQTWHVTAGLAFATTTIALVAGLILGYVLLVTWSEVDPTYNTSLEQLQQCQRERRDLNEMLQTVTKDSRCRLCPDGWLYWRSHCYFFSFERQENRQWNESAEFCQQHNSSLAVITDSAEMDFLQEEMSKSSTFPFLWVGLTDSQEEGRWLWWDGTDVQHYMPVSVHWDTDYRDCADLRGDRSLFAAECEAYGPWACKRES